MRCFSEFWNKIRARDRWVIIAYLALSVCDDLANMALGIAVIAIISAGLHSWLIAFALVLSVIAMYIIVKISVFHMRCKAELCIFEYRYQLISDFGDMVMDTDYETLQSIKEQTRIDRASSAVLSAANRGIEYHINRQIHMAAWLITLLVSMFLVGLLDIRVLGVLILANCLNVGFSSLEHHCMGDRENQLATLQSQQNQLFTQESDKARSDDIVYNHLLPWLLAKNRTSTNTIVRLTASIERIRSSMNAVTGTIAFISTLLIILIVVNNNGNTMQYSALFLYAMMCITIASVVQGAYETWCDLRRNAPIINDWYSYIDELAVRQSEQVNTVPTGSVVEFCDLHYRPSADGPNILNGLSITYQQGQSIAIVGDNGAGKTTLVSIIAGLLQPTSGTIRIDGHTVTYAQYRVFARSNITMLPQDNSLFALSIADNIRLGFSASDNQIREVLDRVHLLEKVESLPNGINTYIGTDLSDSGTELSGGQKRALLIARVLLHPQPICIFDEPTSAFDPVKEGEFYDMMRELCGQRTLIFVSHNIGTTNFCDNVYVLSHGAIVQQGAPSQLSIVPGPYRDLFSGQIIETHHNEQ